MGLGVDGAVVGNLVDLLTLSSDFGDGVFLGFLKLFDDAVHDINKDDLGSTLAFCQHAPSPCGTSYPDMWSFSATKPRPMFPPPKWTAFFSAFLSDVLIFAVGEGF